MLVRRTLRGFALALFSIAASTTLAGPGADSPAEANGEADQQSASASVDLAGEWRMFLPAGWEQVVTIERLGEDRYYFRPPYVMNGTYVVDGGRLIRLTEERAEIGAEATDLGTQDAFAWEIRSRHLLTLVDDPESRSIDYAGAALFRAKRGEAKAPPSAAHEPESPDDKASAKPLGIDVPETKLGVRIFPGPQGSRDRAGQLAFSMTVRNGSDAPIEFDLPAEPGGRSSVAARVRLLDSVAADGAEQPTLLMGVHRLDGDANGTKVTVFPGETATYDVALEWRRDGEHGNRRLQATPKYEIGLSLTFCTGGELQHATGPRGSTVIFQPLEPVR